MVFGIIATATTGNNQMLCLGQVTNNAPRGQSVFVSHTPSLLVAARRPKRGTAVAIGCDVDIM
jgi:hypothetical protein